jgi:hypothetical protein|mmetsp:Transcript_86790/g.144838  ORF Transcript_86790/g.144838 Transcript_86790/m.144838 type:complete len:115 (-) Transcript_86790:17-361(-)
MDALVTDEGDPWDPSEAAVASVHAMCASVAHVLRPCGSYLQISFAQPHFRWPYLEGRHQRVVFPEADGSVYSWAVEVMPIGEAGLFQNFLYTCKTFSPENMASTVVPLEGAKSS